MPSRRLLLTASAAWLALGAGAPNRSAYSRAAAFVKATGDQLVAVANGSDAAQEKRQRLADILNKTVDVDGVARFCLGRFWRQATPAQQQRYMKLFHGALAIRISLKLRDYQGVSFTMRRTWSVVDNMAVDTVVTRPNNRPTDMNWWISNPDSDPKIIDVIVEGSSLRVAQRDDYTSYLSYTNNSISTLVDAMQREIEAVANG